MTGVELTAATLLRLMRDVRRDLAAMDERFDEATKLRDVMARASDSSHSAVLALCLHHYYTAFETLLSRVIRALEGDVPGGADWHVTLLDDAAQPLEPIRPALFAPSLLPTLGELRRFRHFLRNAYAVNLEAARLVVLADELREMHPNLHQDLEQTLEFLNSLFEAIEREGH